TGICEDARAEAIMRSTVDLARHLELHVVAEGIETELVMERLVELGCDTGQGCLIARALPAEQLTARLTSVTGGAVEIPADAGGPVVGALGAKSAPTAGARPALVRARAP